ncbi:MAG TPA: GyrI-like domain-containing protein [Clostridia bacterium]|nr:GyrI-like domain-containing protein [Clostridia bacterium]
MTEISTRKIPECTVYTAEFDVSDMNSFFDFETGINILYDLQYLMQEENPDVFVPEANQGDYNFFEYPMEDNPDGTKHFIYHDMVFSAGKDSPKGTYRFEQMPEINAAVMMCQGPYENIHKGFKVVYDWIEKNGHVIEGPGRISAVHGPWDRDDPEEFVMELQVPIREK